MMTEACMLSLHVPTAAVTCLLKYSKQEFVRLEGPWLKLASNSKVGAYIKE